MHDSDGNDIPDSVLKYDKAIKIHFQKITNINQAKRILKKIQHCQCVSVLHNFCFSLCMGLIIFTLQIFYDAK